MCLKGIAYVSERMQLFLFSVSLEMVITEVFRNTSANNAIYILLRESVM